MNAKAIIITAAVFGSFGAASAQTTHSGHSQMMDHAAPTASTLTEPGQGAFAALSEVVQVLESDPDTDWTRVDLTALRAHLVDMDSVILHAEVSETSLPDGIAAVATGDEATVASLSRMVPAHAAQLARDDRWTVSTSETPDGVTMKVTSDDPAVAERIKGLGFLGLMASQDHHRAHHMMIARGEAPHGH